MTDSRTVLDGATLWIGDGSARAGHLVLAGDRIEAVVPGPYEGTGPVEHLDGLCLSPGLIDLMLLGGFGLSIVRDDPLDIARKLVHTGVTGIQFCSGMLGWDRNLQLAANVRAAMGHDGPDAARVLGWYPEGPFEHPDFTGGSLRELALPPSPANVQRMLDEMGDTFDLINVSPGAEGDIAAIRAFHRAGKVVSMAHSGASAEHTARCLEAGTSVLGHFHCNNRGRADESGHPIATIDDVALVDERVRFVHLICDGVHVDPVLVNVLLRCRGRDAICLVTDAHPSTCCADGPFRWDDGRTFVKHGPVCRTEEGGLVGSAIMLTDHFRNFVRFTGMPPAEAIRTVTLNPAACIGRETAMGRLGPGAVADLVAWDAQLRIQRIWRAGVAVPVAQMDVHPDGARADTPA